MRNSGKTESKLFDLFNLFLILLSIGLLLYSFILHEHYGGITWDEAVERVGTREQLKYAKRVFSGAHNLDFSLVASNFEFYGIVNKVTPYLLEKYLNLSLRNYYLLSHLWVVILSLLTVFLIYHASCLLNFKFKLLAPLLLIGSPLFFGHSIFNIKDIPLACFYTIFTLQLIKYSKSQQHYKNELYQKFDNLLLNQKLILTCVSAGVVISVKFIMVIPILVTGILAIVLTHNIKAKSENINQYKTIKTIFIHSLVFTCLCTVIGLLLIPASWITPVKFMIDSFNAFSRHEWAGCMNYLGKCLGVNNPDWSAFKYILTWAGATFSIINIIMIFLTIITFIMLLVKNFVDYHKINYGILLFIFQATLLPFMAISGNSNVYDGLRHFLFSFPAMAIVSSYALGEIYKYFYNKSYKIYATALIFIVLLIQSVTLVDIAALSPYQYTYINEFSRKKLLNGDTDLDFWGASVGELHDQLNSNKSLFPRGPGPLSNTRKSKVIINPSIDQHNKAQLRYRPYGIDSHSPSLNCNITAKVTRFYPLTAQIQNLSAIQVCSKN